MTVRRYKLRMLTPGQCAAARAWLGWTREELADKAGVSPGTIFAFETQGSDPKVSTLQKLRRAFAQEGLELIEEGVPSHDGGPGLRLRRGVPGKPGKGRKP